MVGPYRAVWHGAELSSTELYVLRYFTCLIRGMCSTPARYGTPRQVHLRMGSTRRARILLKACLGQLLANAPVQAQGEAWLGMAKCEMTEVSLENPWSSSAKASDSSERGGAVDGGGDGGRAGAGGGVAGTARRGEALKRAVLHLDRAIAMLKRCHDFAGLRECFYLKVSLLSRRPCTGSAAAKVPTGVLVHVFDIFFTSHHTRPLCWRISQPLLSAARDCTHR